MKFKLLLIALICCTAANAQTITSDRLLLKNKWLYDVQTDTSFNVHTKIPSPLSIRTWVEAREKKIYDSISRIDTVRIGYLLTKDIISGKQRLKVDSAALAALIAAGPGGSVNTIYTANGRFTTNRTISGANNEILFDSLKKATFSIMTSPSITGQFRVDHWNSSNEYSGGITSQINILGLYAKAINHAILLSNNSTYIVNTDSLYVKNSTNITTLPNAYDKIVSDTSKFQLMAIDKITGAIVRYGGYWFNTSGTNPWINTGTEIYYNNPVGVGAKASDYGSYKFFVHGGDAAIDSGNLIIYPQGVDGIYLGKQFGGSENSAGVHTNFNDNEVAVYNADSALYRFGNKAIRIDETTHNVGLSKIPTERLDVAGTVKATTFSGSGLLLTGVKLSADSLGNNGFTPLWRLNKVKDSLQANIDVNTASISGKLASSGTKTITGKTTVNWLSIPKDSIPITSTRRYALMSDTATGGIERMIVESGTYTPTFTNVANMDATTAYVWMYQRIGNIVRVSGRVDINPTAASNTQTQVGVSLPFASNFTNNQQASGVGVTYGSIGNRPIIQGDATNDRMEIIFLSGGTADQEYRFEATYQIL